jgi:hypothetical protein
MHQGQAIADFISTQPFGPDTKVLLELKAVPERFYVIRRGKHKEVTTLTEVYVLADLDLETIKHGQALQGQADIHLGGELKPDSAGTAPGSFLAEKFISFNKYDILLAAQSKMVGCAGAHHPASDNHDISSFGNHNYSSISSLYWLLSLFQEISSCVISFYQFQPKVIKRPPLWASYQFRTGGLYSGSQVPIPFSLARR